MVVTPFLAQPPHRLIVISDNGPNDSRREAAGPATNVLLAPNVRDTIEEDSSKRTWPVREVGRYQTCQLIGLHPEADLRP